MPFEFVFLRPWWLLLIPVGFVLAYAVTRRHRDSWKRVCDSELFAQLTLISDRISERLAWMLIAAGWLLAVTALAGPAWDRDNSTLYQSVDAMVIVFDLSRSMSSADLQPSRLERARYKALEVLEAQQDKSVGLVAFAGDAFDVAPISDDAGTIAHLLQSLQIRMMPVQGSQASAGLNRARQLLSNSSYQNGAVVLLTDGVDEDVYSSAERLRDSGYRLSVIGVGTEAGSPISLDNGDYLKNAAGEFIVAPVDHESLAELARMGGGLYSLVSEPLSESMLRTIDFGSGSLESAGDDASGVDWNDRGPWLLLALLPLAALMFRRGWILSLIVLLPFSPQPSHALEWEDLWQRSDQQAASAVQREDFEHPRIADHSDWNGIALYRRNRFSEASAEFSKAIDKIAKFNSGNALAKAGELQAAIEQYESALQIDPEFEDAQFNLELLKQALQEQQRQQNQRSESRDDPESDPADAGSSGDRSEETPPDGDRSDSTEQEPRNERRDEASQLALAESSTEEEQQLMEQWLRVIPDDPAGLLRRRFSFEYQRRRHAEQSAIAW